MKLVKIKNDIAIRLFKYVANFCYNKPGGDAFNSCPKDVKSCSYCAYTLQCEQVGTVISEINLNK